MYERSSNHDSDRRFRPEQTPEDELADWITLSAKQSVDWWKGILAPLYREVEKTLSRDEECVLLGNAYSGALLAIHTSDAGMFRDALVDIACVTRGFEAEVIRAKVDHLVAAEQPASQGVAWGEGVQAYDGMAQPYNDDMSGADLLDYMPPAPDDDFSDFWGRS